MTPKSYNMLSNPCMVFFLFYSYLYTAMFVFCGRYTLSNEVTVNYSVKMLEGTWYIIISKHRDVGGMKFTGSFVDTLIKESYRKHILNMDTCNLDEKY